MLRKLFVALAAFLLASATLVFGVNQFSLSVIMEGEERIAVEYGDTYEDPGARLIFRGTVFFREGIVPEKAMLTVRNSVDDTRLGRYSVSYTADYLWFRGEAQRVVSVVDTQCPVITLMHDSGEIVLPYTEAGYTAWDDHDGDITDQVIRQEHMGKITYAVTDSSGNPAYVERTVPFHDPIPPQIHLEGGTEYKIPAASAYKEPGYAAADNVDGDVTAQVTVKGTVDSLRPGIYPISYSVSDAYGNETIVIRYVEVTAAKRPETNWPQDKTVYLTFDDGPGPYTEKLLDVLDIYGVKATFFVTDGEYNHLMREIVDRGHSIGIHTVTHDYALVYDSPESFFEDLLAMRQIIYNETGIQTSLMRFPGGSSNKVSQNTCEGIMTFLTEAVQDAGFRYFDWNVDSDDAGLAHNSRSVGENVIQGIAETGIALVLQHDIHAYSVDAVADILQWGMENGYQFLSLEYDSPNFPHPLNN